MMASSNATTRQESAEVDPRIFRSGEYPVNRGRSAAEATTSAASGVGSRQGQETPRVGLEMVPATPSHRGMGRLESEHSAAPASVIDFDAALRTRLSGALSAPIMSSLDRSPLASSEPSWLIRLQAFGGQPLMVIPFGSGRRSPEFQAAFSVNTRPVSDHFTLRVWHLVMLALPFFAAFLVYAGSPASGRTAEDFKATNFSIFGSRPQTVHLEEQVVMVPGASRSSLGGAAYVTRLPAVIVEISRDLFGVSRRKPARAASTRVAASDSPHRSDSSRQIKTPIATAWYDSLGKDKAQVSRQASPHSASGSASRDGSAKSTPPALLPDSPSRRQVLASMNSVRSRVHACAPDYAGSVVPVRVTVSSSGKVSNAVVSGRLADSSEAKCIAAALRDVSFPEFKKEKFVIDYPFLI